MSSGSENLDSQVRKWLTKSTGGDSFGDILLPEAATLRRIYVHCADLVDGLQFEYGTPDGGGGVSRFAGGVGGWRHVFDLPEGEKLRAVSGSFGKFVNSLRFHTGSVQSREYGVARGERFFLDFGGEFRFRGIFGREGLYLDSLGLVLQSISGARAELPWSLPRTLGVPQRPIGREDDRERGASEPDRKAA